MPRLNHFQRRQNRTVIYSLSLKDCVIGESLIVGGLERLCIRFGLALGSEVGGLTKGEVFDFGIDPFEEIEISEDSTLRRMLA